MKKNKNISDPIENLKTPAQKFFARQNREKLGLAVENSTEKVSLEFEALQEAFKSSDNELEKNANKFFSSMKKRYGEKIIIKSSSESSISNIFWVENKTFLYQDGKILSIISPETKKGSAEDQLAHIESKTYTEEEFEAIFLKPSSS